MPVRSGATPLPWPSNLWQTAQALVKSCFPWRCPGLGHDGGELAMRAFFSFISDRDLSISVVLGDVQVVVGAEAADGDRRGWRD